MARIIPNRRRRFGFVISILVANLIMSEYPARAATVPGPVSNVVATVTSSTLRLVVNKYVLPPEGDLFSHTHAYIRENY